MSAARTLRAAGRGLAANYSIFLALVAYELLSRSGLVSPRLIPSLVVIGEQLWRYTLNGDLPYHAGISLYRAFAGFLLATVVGVAFGVAMARSRWFDALFEPIFSFGYPIPKISLYPIFIFVFGLGTGSKVALVFLECLYPIAIHAAAGVRTTDRVLIWAAENMGASRWQLFFRVMMPAALPTLFTGLRIALPVALIVTLLTEIIGESRGLGYFITFASASFEYARAMAAFVVVAVIGFALDRGVVALRRRIVFWQKDAPTIG
jgi:ABC-type nitrate/sulfonate/bicarbonate transport system permease component